MLGSAVCKGMAGRLLLGDANQCPHIWACLLIVMHDEARLCSLENGTGQPQAHHHSSRAAAAPTVQRPRGRTCLRLPYYNLAPHPVSAPCVCTSSVETARYIHRMAAWRAGSLPAARRPTRPLPRAHSPLRPARPTRLDEAGVQRDSLRRLDAAWTHQCMGMMMVMTVMTARPALTNQSGKRCRVHMKRIPR